MADVSSLTSTSSLYRKKETQSACHTQMEGIFKSSLADLFHARGQVETLVGGIEGVSTQGTVSVRLQGCSWNVG